MKPIEIHNVKGF